LEGLLEVVFKYKLIKPTLLTKTIMTKIIKQSVNLSIQKVLTLIISVHKIQNSKTYTIYLKKTVAIDR